MANISQTSAGKSLATSAWYITDLDDEAKDMITQTVVIPWLTTIEEVITIIKTS